MTDRLQYPLRKQGLDHGWFQHSTILQRPKVTWPNGAHVALWITVPIEFFPLDVPTPVVRPLGGLDRGYPDFWSYSNRDYGMRIGIFRIMNVLDALGLSATAAVNGHAVTEYPEVMSAIAARHWEIIANGLDMGHAHHAQVPLEHEQSYIDKTKELLAPLAGSAGLLGWHSPGHSQSAQTMRLLAEAKFKYVADWVNDETPYWVTTPAGRLVAMPLTYELSDRLLLVQHNLTLRDYENHIGNAFERLMEEATAQGPSAVFSLSISPWILGYPHRIAGLRRVLEKVMASGRVWNATGRDIVQHFSEQVPAAT